MRRWMIPSAPHTRGRPSTVVVTLLATVLVALSHATLQAQQSPQTPVFRAGTDLIEVDVTVLDGRGAPLTDLLAAEFSVRVDGEPREVVTAEFIDMAADPDTGDGADDSGVGFYSSNTEATRGRLIVIMIDRSHMTFGGGAPITRAAARFLDSLMPHDRVALVTLPQPGPRLDFTANHALVSRAVDGLVGFGHYTPGELNIGLHEALTLVDQGSGSPVAVALMERLCGHTRPGSFERDVCERQVEREARAIVQDQEKLTTDSLRALESIIDALGAIDGPKHLVWISEGMVTEPTGADLRPIEQAAARTRTTVHVLLADPPLIDTSIGPAPPTPLEDRARQELGLQQLAAYTRGVLRRVGPNPDAAFARIDTELGGYYLLGVESLPTDQDGEAHTIDVSVSRRGARVRARRVFVIPSASDPLDRTPAEELQRVLGAPFVTTGIPLRLATYAFQAEDPLKVRVMVAAEIDTHSSAPAELSVGLTMRGADSTVVMRGEQQITLTPVERSSGHVFEYVAAFDTDPGRYMLRFGVTDETGRAGSVEHEVQAWQLTDVPFAVSDLLLVDGAEAARDLVAPVQAIASSGRLAVYTELYADEATALENLDVRVEIAPFASEEVLVRESGIVRAGAHPFGRVVSAMLSTDGLGPGTYQARVAVARGSEPVAQLSRPFLVTSAPTAVGVAAVGVRDVERLMPAPASPDVMRELLGDAIALHPDTLLSDDVLAFFMDRVDDQRPGLQSITRRVRTGELTGAGRSAFETGDQLAAAFLRGLELFAEERWNQAATQFTAALRVDPQFSPAAFYLGACYAVGGRDGEAATHLRRALVDAEHLPIAHRTLADALVRSVPSDAIVVLQDALGRWPDDDLLLRQLAIAYAVQHEYEDAMRVIRPYLSRHPGDHVVLLLAVMTLFSAHVDGSTLTDQDVEQMRAYANGYLAVPGPHAQLVRDWLHFVSTP